MKDSEVENVIITAATYVRHELNQLLEDRKKNLGLITTEHDPVVRKELEKINGYVGFDKHLIAFLEQKTSAKDVITAINVLLRKANQSPVNEVTLRTILEAAEVIRINKSDPLFNAKLVHSPNGIILERYVSASKLKKRIIERIREHFDEYEIETATKKLGPLEALSVDQLWELEERLIEKKQKSKVKVS